MNFRTIKFSDPKFETGGLRHVTVKSNALHKRVDATIYIPEQAKQKKSIPVVVLLHGLYGSHWAWCLTAGAHLSLQRLIDQESIGPYVLVTPSDGLWGDGSAYVQHTSENYEEWISSELPGLIKQEIDCVDESSSFYIGGLSMGGWGAMWVGLRHPDVYKAISAHSSITNINQMKQFVEEDWSKWIASHEIHSIEDLILNQKNKDQAFRFDCGTEDDLLPANRALHKTLVDAGIPHTYEEFSGAHEWPYWEEHVIDSYRFFDNIENG